MDIFWIRILSQTGIYATFAVYLAGSLRRGPREWVPLLGTVWYAVIFEHFNMLRYANSTGGYTYHPQSWLFLWHDVPLYIPLAWAFIVATSRALTDEIITAKWAKPFCDALLALLIDFSLDVVAIRLHFWTWRGVGWNDAFFGVPADNFLGWLLVTFTFSALTRTLWERPPPETHSSKSISTSQLQSKYPSQREQITMPLQTRALQPAPLHAEESSDTLDAEEFSDADAVTYRHRFPWRQAALQIALLPLAAYVLYLLLEAVVHGGYVMFHAVTLRRQLGVFAGVLALFVAATLRGLPSPAAATGDAPAKRAVEPLHASLSKAGMPARWQHVRLHAPRHIFHIFALIGFFCLPLAVRSPTLLLVAFGVWMLELLVTWRASRRPAHP